MRILFMNHVFPGHFGPLAAAFAADPAHEVKFLSNRSRRDFCLPGVGHVILRAEDRRSARHSETDRVLAAGRQALKAFDLLRRNGFVPDLVLIASAWEYGLYLHNAFPDVFTVCCADAVPRIFSEDANGAKLLQILLQSRLMLECDLCLIQTAGEPGPLAGRLSTAAALPYPVDTAGFARSCAGPAAVDGEPLPDEAEVTLFSVADREEARQAVRVAERLTALRPACRAVLLCEAGMRERVDAEIRPLLQSVPRVSLPQALTLREYRNLLCAAGLVVFSSARPTPSVLLEAMSCEAAPVLPAVHSPLLRPGENVILFPETEDPASFLAELWDDPALPAVQRNARRTVLEHFRQQDVISRHVEAIMAACKKSKECTV